MSKTYSLICPELKLSLWIGQSLEKGNSIYNTKEYTDRLSRFLVQTMNKQLICICNDTNIIYDVDDYLEFEEDTNG